MVFVRHIDDRTTADEELRAIRSVFERSDEWRAHLEERHNEDARKPKPVLWEEDRPSAKPERDEPAEEAPRVRHRVKVGGCECQPRLGFMELGEKGDVQPAVPQPVEEQREQYGAAPAGSAGTYGVSPGGHDVYNASGQGQDLYR